MTKKSCFFSDNRHRYRIVANKIKGKKVLDVGGYKDCIVYFNKGIIYKSLNYHGSWYRNRKAHIYCKKRFPFVNNFFDSVICVDTLEHIPKNKRNYILREMLRVARRRLLILYPFNSKENVNFETEWYKLSKKYNIEVKPALVDHIKKGLPSDNLSFPHKLYKIKKEYFTSRETFKKFMLAQTFVNICFKSKRKIIKINKNLQNLMESSLLLKPISRKKAYRCLLIIDLERSARGN